jgi:hypothetical protein
VPVWRKWMVPAVLALAVLAGCESGDDTVAPSTTTTDACTLLDPADVESAIGRSFGAGAPLQSGAAKGCEFDALDDSGSVQVFVSTGTNEQGFKELKASYPDPEPTSGLGDEAAWSDRLHTLMVRKGTAVVIVSFNLKSDVEQLDWAKDVATAALGRVTG